jgi:hypothetical protein
LVLALSVTSPAFAKKKKGDDSSETATSGDSSAKKTKKGKKGDDADKPAPEASASDTASETKKPDDTLGGGEPQETPDSNSWERPPAEQEKPAAPPPKPVEKPKGSDRPISVALFAGWAFKTDRQVQFVGASADPYQFGGGLRGGYSFDFHLYIGAYFSYYIGSSVTGTPQQVNTGTATSRASYMQFGTEVGYDWWVGPVIVRPSLELGWALAFTSFTGVGMTTQKTVGDFMVGPGLAIVHPWDNVFLGGEGRFLIVTGDGVSAFLLAATFGMRFE